jgi:hypothetical protein
MSVTDAEDRLQRLGPEAAGLMARVLGQFGVGELAPMERHGLTLLLHGQHRLWSQQGGVLEARRWGKAAA